VRDDYIIPEGWECLAEPGVFAVLLIQTLEDKTLIRPIGGQWHPGIIDAIEEADKTFPSCKVKLLERNYNDWRKYFRGVVPNERLLT